jgi:ABC-type Fe3+ transport system permease subunit
VWPQRRLERIFPKARATQPSSWFDAVAILRGQLSKEVLSKGNMHADAVQKAAFAKEPGAPESVLPGMAYALVVLATLRTLGVQPRYSMASVIFAWILAGTPYLASVFSRARADLDPRNGEALRSLGASSFLRFWHHDFLGTRGAQVEALLQQFWLYLTSFSLVLILNGGPPNETLEVSIFTSMRLGEPRLGRALAYALIQSSLLVLLRIALNRLQGKEAEGPGVVEWGSGFRRSSSGLLVGIVITSVFVVRMGSDLESVD